MKHLKLGIKPSLLNLIRNGKKTNEYRLCTPDRNKIEIGDRLILISNQSQIDAVCVSVTNICKYKTAEEAVAENWQNDFFGKCHTLEESAELLVSFFKQENIEKYGIVKFAIKPVARKLRNNRVLLDTNIIIQRESYTNVSFEVSKMFKWFEKLHSSKLIYQKTRNELEKFYDKKEVSNLKIKLESYNPLIFHKIEDKFFMEKMNLFSQDDNSIIDNEILYQVYDDLADLFITNDRKILQKAELLGIRQLVLSVDEYLKIVESEFPDKVDYKILSIKKEKFGNIDLSDDFFTSLKHDYPEFSSWFNKKSQEEAYVFKRDNKVRGFLYVKVEYEDEPGYLEINPPLSKKKRLKVGTFKIDSSLRGFRLGERFIKIIFDNALENKVDEIYVTLFENHRKEIDRLKDQLCKWGFCYYGTKDSNLGKKESVYVKTLESYDLKMGVKFNFPVVNKQKRIFMLPINPEYHTSLFPDSILKNENTSLYSGNKGSLYALEKIYVTNSYASNVRPGDFVVIYRIGERYPKRFFSVCTGIAVIEDIKTPKSLEDYLNECSNKSVFTKEELNDFYTNKKYRTVIKLIPYETYLEKISLDKLINVGFIDEFSGPRPFEEVPERFRHLFFKDGD